MSSGILQFDFLIWWGAIFSFFFYTTAQAATKGDVTTLDTRVAKAELGNGDHFIRIFEFIYPVFIKECHKLLMYYVQPLVSNSVLSYIIIENHKSMDVRLRTATRDNVQAFIRLLIFYILYLCKKAIDVCDVLSLYPYLPLLILLN